MEDIELHQIAGPKVVRGQITSRVPLGKLEGTEPKYGVVIKGEEEVTNLIERHPASNSVPEAGHNDPVEYTVRKIQMLEQKGYPMPVFYKGQEDALYSENATAKGGGIYGKSALERLVRQGKSPTDELFLSVFRKNYDEIFGRDDNPAPDKSLWWWLNKANSDGVLLPPDDAMELLIKPDGTFAWMIFDPVGASTITELAISKDKLAERNLQAVKSLFDDITLVFRELIK